MQIILKELALTMIAIGFTIIWFGLQVAKSKSKNSYQNNKIILNLFV